MAIDEISNLVAQRLLQGAMNHEQFTNYYNFLGLEGYKLFHEYHFLEEICGYRKFIDYYIEHYNRFVPHFSFNSLSSFSIIPDNWYNYMREDVDIATRRNAIKNGLEKYVHWERDTKSFLEDMYSQAVGQGEAAISIKIKDYIQSVDEEIKLAERCYLEIKSTDYDLPTVISKQQELIKKYSKKIKKLREEFEHDQSARSRGSDQRS